MNPIEFNDHVSSVDVESVNRTMANVRPAFQKYFREKERVRLVLPDLSDHDSHA
jgi:hypothetical protein